MRSARVAIAAAALLLIALPLAMLAVARGYELLLVQRYHARLAGVADKAVERGPLELPALGKREGVELRLLDQDGAVVADSHTEAEAMIESLLGSTVESLLGRLGAAAPKEPLDEVESSFGPLAGREEVRAALAGEESFALRTSPSGHTVVVSHAMPRPGGGAVYVLKASHRGIRQLLLVRHEFEKLVGYQTVFALVWALALSRWLVRPLERLARGAKRYPYEAVAAPELLERRDEIGQLARAITALAHSLEAKQRATAELAADLAHEFKNPLATIAASAELIASTQDASEKKRALVQGHIAGAVERLRATTDELLALVRLEAALPAEKRVTVAYTAWLDELLSEYRRDPRWAGFTFRVEVGPEVGEVSIVATAWARLLRNLLDNALAQPASRSEVSVRAFRRGGGVMTEVEDCGPGVSEGNRDKIFRRFFTHRPEGQPAGTGLGLSIVQTVAQAHGGSVELAPSRAGMGATFRVFLPSAAPER
ncbi:MAG: sensor histidine kinase [Myxococcaceae bacterium]